jgi:hypothetical protein
MKAQVFAQEPDRIITAWMDADELNLEFRDGTGPAKSIRLDPEDSAELGNLIADGFREWADFMANLESK